MLAGLVSGRGEARSPAGADEPGGGDYQPRVRRSAVTQVEWKPGGM